MMTLVVKRQRGKILATNRGTFHIESLYFIDDIVMDDETGEIYFIKGSVKDENGKLSELKVD